jgi:hypothetical protein
MEDIVSGRKIKTFAAFILVLAALFASATTVLANTVDASVSSEYGRGGIWSNVLSPYLYYPSGEVHMPALNVGQPVVDRQQEILKQALMQFTTHVINGDHDVVTGVFVNDVMAYPVIQQPSGSAAYVSTQEDVVTQFALAQQYGTIGILAHNFLAGLSFFDLSSGQDVYVVYGDGTTVHYVITDVRRFQALQPNSPYSEFIDLDTDAHYTSSDVFYEVYGNDGKLVLQTCIAADGVDSWGRLFVIAEQIS